MKFQNNSDTIVLSDSFKSTLSSREIGALWKQRCGFDFLPVSDGGEGALEAVDSVLEGEYALINDAEVYIDGTTAYIESAKIVGYDIKKDVYARNTYDLGTLVKALLEREILKIVIFIGGTSTNDGGFGMLEALGYDFLDELGEGIRPIPSNFSRIKSVKTKELPCVEIIACTDVTNELCGLEGATYIYGSQKGVRDHEVLDAEIKRIASFINPKKMKIAGTGAGGGIGYALSQFKQFEFIDGYSFISELADYPEIISKYQRVITGEGKLDAQTMNGKLPYRILQDAKKSHTETHGVFAIVEESELIKDFQSVNYIAVNNEATEENFKNTVQNYNHYISSYKYKSGIYKGVLFILDTDFLEADKQSLSSFMQELTENKIEVRVLSDLGNISAALKELDLSVYECIVISDSQRSIDASKTAGIDSIAIGKDIHGAMINLDKIENLTLDIFVEAL